MDRKKLQEQLLNFGSQQNINQTSPSMQRMSVQFVKDFDKEKTELKKRVAILENQLRDLGLVREELRKMKEKNLLLEEQLKNASSSREKEELKTLKIKVEEMVKEMVVARNALQVKEFFNFD